MWFFMKGCDLPARDPFFLSPYNTETHTVFYICSDACAAAPICIRMRTQQSSIAHHTTQRDIYRNIEQALCCCREKGYWVTLNMRAQVDNRYVCAEIFAKLPYSKWAIRMKIALQSREDDALRWPLLCWLCKKKLPIFICLSCAS